MALDMDSATYARSVKGATKLYTDFSDDIDKIIKALNGSKYTDLKKVVKENWVGADATYFLNEVEKSRGTLETKLKALKTKVKGAIDADTKQFASFQSSNKIK